VFIENMIRFRLVEEIVMKIALIGLLVTVLIVFFNNCGPVKFATSKTEAPSATPNPPNGPSGPPGQQGTRDVNLDFVVQTPNSKLDILLIIDDSNSMLADNQKLASRLSGFTTQLQSANIDWQMCVTVTRALPINNNPSWGLSMVWSGYTPASGVPNWVLRPTSNVANIFTATINNIGAGWAGTDDERGTKAAYWHVYNGDVRFPNHSRCHRADAALAMILISDEDIRSVGGNASAQYYAGEYKPLENEDEPATLLNYVKEVFGNQKRFTFNSIIVRPGDATCMQLQDAGGAKSHYGVKYKEMSDMTAGGVGSICESNYSNSLNLFADSIENSIASQALECVPVGAVEVTVNPQVPNLTSSVSGASISFSPRLPNGRSVNLKYKCAL